MPDVYRVIKESMIIGRTRYKNLESFFTPKIVKYTAHIEKVIPGISIPPLAAHEIIIGNDINIILPVKL